METINVTAAAAEPHPVIQTADSSPYPPLCVCGQNLMYANLLQRNAFSGESELTSISTYLFQGWNLHPELTVIAETFHSIAKVEMHHLDMLGTLILALGGTPTFSAMAGRRNIVWDGNMTRYSTCLEPMLRGNILSEQAAIDSYCKHASIIEDGGVAAVLKRIVLDEQIHLAIFKTYLCSLSES